MDTQVNGPHYVAVFGGAVAGSEAAHQLSAKGIKVVVFDQSLLPYGKIEDGLPKWHHKLRDQEERKIDEKLDHPDVEFVPGIKLGRDISIEECIGWGFSAIILATGAWRDKPVPIKDIDNFVGNGFYYQNPFVYWFNHHHEPAYKGPACEIMDNAIVIGGGLASLDVVKILMMETVSRALMTRGIDRDLLTLEKKGIAAVLGSLDLTLEDLEVKGCTLYYRRRDIDMPLYPMAARTEEQLAKAQAVRKKILDNFRKKYLFRFVPCSMPVDKIVQGNKLVGIKFQRTRVVNNKVIPEDNAFFNIEAPLVISSIGSIPERIEGLPYDGSVFEISDRESCQIAGYDNVFAIGNAVTGKGNINESVKHSREISTGLIENFFEWQHREYQRWHRQTAKKVDHDMDRIMDKIEDKPALTGPEIDAIFTRVRKLQAKAGYDGHYKNWIKMNLPVRYEKLVVKK